ncbi:MAG TPA: Ig-like domain-containing protein [Gemmatimonadales bacterium]|nr:Ig-like domain-containing protein [Gemmatimonadales bacterium]
MPARARAGLPFIYRFLARSARLAGVALALALGPARLVAQAAELQLTPETLTLEAGKRQAIYAAAYDRQGNLVTSAGISFTSSDSGVATVSKDGTVLAIARGTAEVVARAGTLTARTTVTVTGGAPTVAVASIRVEPRAVWLLPLEPARLSVAPRLADGSPAVGARIRWRTLDTKVATVDRDGLVVGTGPGQTLVEAATAAGPADTVLVSVDTALFTTLERASLAPGAVDTLIASVPAQNGRRLGAGLTWTSSDTAVVTAGGNGEIRARIPGEAVVTVSGYGMTGRTEVFVHRPVHSLTITPRSSAGPVRLVPGASRRFEVLALSADSTPVAEAGIVWTLPDSSIATFSPESGLLEARQPGTATLTARLDGFEATTWTVEVIPAALSLDRTRIGLARGGRTRLRATVVDEQGALVPGLEPPLTWSSSSPAVSIGDGGEIEARALGRATVAAASPSARSAAAEVFVTGDLLVSASRSGSAPQALAIQHFTPGESELVPILADSAANIEAAYSPDRSRIAFSSDRGGTFDLYVMDADGANVTRLTSEPGSEGAPAWSPDGMRIFFTADRPGGTQVASVALDGSDLRVLTASSGGNRSPSVSADGRSVAFVSARDGNAEIYRMGPDGGNQRRVTNDDARDQSPRWLPDGSLLYVSSRQRGAVIMRLGPAGAVPVVESPDPILSLAAAPDGRRIAYVAGRMLDRGGSRIEYRLVVQPLEGGAASTALRLAPGDQVATPSF